MLLSIIVPVYNEERYLERCIESLLRLHVAEYEILLIDDGSTDQSSEICDAYAWKYEFIHAVHTANGGVSSAREQGIKHANGKYITFVDGDDWVGEEIFTEFLSHMEQDDALDVCIGGLRKVFSDGVEYTVCHPYSPQFMTNTDAMREMLQWKKFRWELCGNVYRKNLFCEFNLSKNIRVGEDLISNFIILRYAHRIFYAPIYQYYYFTNLDSATESNRYKMESLMKPFFAISRLGIQDEDINMNIQEFYVKEIMKDILYRFFFDDKFLENIPFYRKELKTLLTNPRILFFIKQYFDEKAFMESLTENILFSAFWQSIFYNLRNEFIYHAKHYKNMYIYGTGVISRFITIILKQHGIRYDSYVVSDGHGKKDEDVKYLSEITDDNKDTVFILALASVYHAEVIKLLEKKEYTNYFVPAVITGMYR